MIFTIQERTRRGLFVIKRISWLSVLPWVLLLSSLSLSNEPAEPPFEIRIKREGDQVLVGRLNDSKLEPSSYRLDVVSSTGIGEVTLVRKSRESWPVPLEWRLRWKGLESLAIDIDGVPTFSASISSGDGTQSLQANIPSSKTAPAAKDGESNTGYKGVNISKDDKRWFVIRSEKSKQREGRSEHRAWVFTLPEEAYREANSITIRWIDYYR